MQENHVDEGVYQHHYLRAEIDQEDNQQHGSNDMYNGIDDSIAKQIELEILDKMYYKSLNMVTKLALQKGRCSICTLMRPCRHIDAKSAITEEENCHQE